MKQLTLSILALLCLHFCHAQNTPSLFIHLGRDLSNKSFNNLFKGISNPSTFSIDKLIGHHLSFGTYLSHRKLQLKNNSKIIGSDTYLGLRAHINFKLSPKATCYFGGMIGGQIIKLKEHYLKLEKIDNQYTKKWQTKGIANIHLGIRYFPKTWFGYFFELGLGYNLTSLGISIKL